MDLHPHLHLMVPSSTHGISLEVRLYVAREIIDHMAKTAKSIKGLSHTSTSIPLPVDELDYDTLAGLRNVERLIIASHPWGRFGGNMLYPYVPIILRLYLG